MGDVQLRPYKNEDHPSVLRLIESRYPEIGTQLDLQGSEIDLTDIDYYWRKCGGEFMVLTRKEEIIGCICARPLKERRFCAEFDWFFLRKNEEGKGLGLILLNWALEWCRQKDIRIIELWSSEKRTSTHKIYRKIGFKHNGIKKLWRDNPPHYVLYFELDLLDSKTKLCHERYRKLLENIGY